MTATAKKQHKKRRDSLEDDFTDFIVHLKHTPRLSWRQKTLACNEWTTRCIARLVRFSSSNTRSFIPKCSRREVEESDCQS